jgi:hypothetical protein
MSTETTDATEQAAEETVTQSIPISRAALALHNLAAKEETRPLLATIWTKAGRYTTADGFIGGMVKPADEAAPPDGLIIPRATAQAAVAKTSAKKRAASIDRTEGGGEIVTEAKPHERITYSAPGGVDATLCIASLRHKDAPHAATVVNVENLKKITTFFSTAMAGTDGIVELRVWGPGKALEFRARSAENEELTAVLMPMVIGGYGNAEPWLFDPVPGVDDRGKLLPHHIQRAVEGGAAGSTEDRFATVRAYLAGLGYPEEHVTQALEALYAHDKQVAYDEVFGEPAVEAEATAAD